MKDSQTFNLAQLSWDELKRSDGDGSMGHQIDVGREMTRRINMAHHKQLRSEGISVTHDGAEVPIHPPMAHDYYPHH